MEPEEPAKARSGGDNPPPGDAEASPLAPPFRPSMKVTVFLYFALLLVGLGLAADYVFWARQRDGWDMRPTGLVPTTPAPASTKPPTGEAEPQAPTPQTMPLLGARMESASSTPAQQRRFSYDPFIFIVAFIGAGGGCLHGLTSLVYHSGHHRGPRQGWAPFYFALPFTGAGMAVAIYLLLRGGLGGFEVSAEGDPEFTYAAWAALGGLFSPGTLAKLQDIFDAVFQPGKLRQGKPPSEQS